MHKHKHYPMHRNIQFKTLVLSYIVHLLPGNLTNDSNPAEHFIKHIHIVQRIHILHITEVQFSCANPNPYKVQFSSWKTIKSNSRLVVSSRLTVTSKSSSRLV